MSEPSGGINEYVCQKCGYRTQTVNRDSGTTPFMMRCRSWPITCDGMAQSCFYKITADHFPQWEWIVPTDEEFEAWIKAYGHEEHRENLLEHIRKGGMILRKLEQESMNETPYC